MFISSGSKPTWIYVSSVVEQILSVVEYYFYVISVIYPDFLSGSIFLITQFEMWDVSTSFCISKRILECPVKLPGLKFSVSGSLWALFAATDLTNKWRGGNCNRISRKKIRFATQKISPKTGFRSFRWFPDSNILALLESGRYLYVLDHFWFRVCYGNFFNILLFEDVTESKSTDI